MDKINKIREARLKYFNKFKNNIELFNNSEELNSSNQNNNNDKCPICYEKVNINSSIGKCCGDHGVEHHFHIHCLERWINNGINRTCPICRGRVIINQNAIRQNFNTNNSLNSLRNLIDSINDDREWIDLNSIQKTGVTIGFFSSLYSGYKIGESIVNNNNDLISTNLTNRLIIGSNNVSQYNKFGYSIGYIISSINNSTKNIN
jgi:hypothetical protein